MIQKEFKTLTDEELCCVQGGGMFVTTYMGYHPPVSVENGYQTGSKLMSIYERYRGMGMYP